MQEYEITIAGCRRKLPVCAVNEDLSIAAFIMFGDVEITEQCAKALLQKCPAHDVILTAEAKAIPLCYEMARIGCRDYVVARKTVKVYMHNPISVQVRSITTQREQSLFFAEDKAGRLRGRRVLIVDDVISTGNSLRALEDLVSQAGGTIVGKAAVLAEGDAAKRDDIIFLQPLPLFLQGAAD